MTQNIVKVPLPDFFVALVLPDATREPTAGECEEVSATNMLEYTSTGRVGKIFLSLLNHDVTDHLFPKNNFLLLIVTKENCGILDKAIERRGIP